jgi:hypothetical protein
VGYARGWAARQLASRLGEVAVGELLAEVDRAWALG